MDIMNFLNTIWFKKWLVHISKCYVQYLLGHQNECCLVHMDHIMVYCAIHEHISKFLINPEADLGHWTTQDGVKPNPTKIVFIENPEESKKLKDIKSCQDLTSYKLFNSSPLLCEPMYISNPSTPMNKSSRS